MPLGPGVRLGPYEIVSALGAGGMGEVYRARDTRLGRDVAIKVLADAVASNADRIARFEREAKVLASLNHPHIATVYGIEEPDGQRGSRTRALVMELVEGDTLAARLQQGPLPIRDALRFAVQIADALESAHEQGIIHRDLKPSNIAITRDDKIKVLDFGLAKLNDPATANAPRVAAAVSMSPTLSVLDTQAGVILGTAAFMSPEQAKGLPADHRSDIFSFGCVLYEMLTGRQLFQGDSAPDILAAVIVREADLSVLPADLNTRLVDLLRRCLDKNPRRRWQAIGDVRAELEVVAASPTQTSVMARRPGSARPLWQAAAAFAATALIAGSVGGAAVWRFKAAPSNNSVVRFSLTMRDEQFTQIARGSLAISPDGTRLAYIAAVGANSVRLVLRSMSELEGRPLPVPESGLYEPAFSPDGQWIAFYADGAIRRIAIAGGAPLTISPVRQQPFGLTWDADGILFGQGTDGVFNVSPNGGTPQRLLALKDGEWAHGPRKLPGTNTIIYTLSRGTTPGAWDAADIVAQAIGSTDRKVLVKGARDARYVSTGHLVYATGGVLFAAPFDIARTELTGPPVPLVDGVRRSTQTATAHYVVSDSGTLMYVPGPTGATTGRVDIVMADRKGVVERLMIPTGPYEYPRVSPDGTRLAFGTSGSDQDIWIYDFGGRTAPRRLTFGGHNRFPLWSADGRRVAFQSDRQGDGGIFWQAADGTGTAERLTKADAGTTHVPEAWSPTGSYFLFTVMKGITGGLWSFSLSERKGQPLAGVITNASGRSLAASFSPDGKWFLYSTETGLYVQPFPQTGATYQIGGGFHPWWTRDGKEIVFVPNFGRLGLIRISITPTLTFGAPSYMSRPFNEKLGPTIGKNYDVTPDGRFVGLAAPGEAQGSNNQIAVVLNWGEELKRLVPTR